MSNANTPITLKIRQITDMQVALNALDGRQEPCEVTSQDGRTVKSVQTIPYKFSGAARITAARWLTALTPHIESFKKAHEGLVKQHSDPATPNAVAAGNLETFREQLTVALETAVEFNLPRIKIADLNTEENRLPVSILAVLDPILDY